MTRRELHASIAETLEPRPDMPPALRVTARGIEDGVSRKGIWRSPASDTSIGWIPPDFDNDEAANAMLLEKMPRGVVGKRVTYEKLTGKTENLPEATN